MAFETLLSAAPFIGGMVIIVISFINYLSRRDKEMRKMAELFSDRVGSLEGTVKEMMDTIRNLKEFLMTRKE